LLREGLPAIAVRKKRGGAPEKKMGPPDPETRFFAPERGDIPIALIELMARWR
jgi:hypothetical protein